tara:strand:+ start:822 stop:1136 length:315 start_codon:yes stop_codon:yes gene_type:complete
MIVVNPSNSTHNAEIVLRKSPSDSSFTVELKDDLTKLITSISVNYTIVNQGKINFSFDHDFISGDSYQIKILDVDNTILYRGLLYATSQVTQEFELTDGKYFWS